MITLKNPQEKIEKLAYLKNQQVEMQHADEIILTAGTVVAFKQTFFGKPTSKPDASDMLVTLSGQAHDIFTGVAIRSAQIESVFSVQTTVEFWSLTENEIKWYVATGEPFGKAEGYAIHFVYQSNQRGLLRVKNV